MGYSLSLPCQSILARDRFSAFLKEHMRPWSTVVLDGDHQGQSHLHYDPTAHVYVGEEIAYGGSSLKVGFNFSSSIDTLDYMLAVLRFGALRVGRKRTMKKLTGITRTVPYVCYDSEAWPVLLETPKGDAFRKSKQWLVDDLGCQPITRPSSLWEPHKKTKAFIKWLTKEEKVLGERERLIAVEMLRLHLLWEKK